MSLNTYHLSPSPQNHTLQETQARHHHDQMILRLAGITACCIHALIALAFLITQRATLFPSAFGEPEKPVLIGDPYGGAVPQPHAGSDSDETQDEPVTGEAPIHESDPLPPEPSTEAPVEHDTYPEPLPHQNTHAPARYAPRPDREARQARWRKTERPPDTNTPYQTARHTQSHAQGRALQQAFSAYSAARATPAARSESSRGGNGNSWGERAQKNAAQVELDMYIRRLMQAFKERASFFEETVTVSHSTHTRVSVILIIERSGRLRHVEVRPSTGIPDVDQSIERFCRYATIPPLPSTYPSDELVLPIDVRIEQAAGVHRMRFIVDAG